MNTLSRLFIDTRRRSLDFMQGPSPASISDTKVIGLPRPRIAIIGAGPIGLEAGVAASQAGFDFRIFEKNHVANHIRQWGHVTLFTPFSMNHSAAGVEAIQQSQTDYKPPLGDAFLSGQEYVDRYVAPLSQSNSLRDHMLENHRVVSVGRSGYFKPMGVGKPGRATAPFRLLVEVPDDQEKIFEADVVIDSSGIYSQPNRLGHGGIEAIGERKSTPFVRYTLDDVTGEHRHLYEGKHILLVGAGYSAATTILALHELVESNPNTNIVWLTTRADAAPIKEIDNDRLHARQQLASRANQIARECHPRLRHIDGIWIERLASTSKDSIVVDAIDEHGDHQLFEVDRVLANIGYRPDRSIYSELHIHECYATDAPIKLAASLMSQGATDCLDRKPTGIETLVNPEPNFFILGAKSFGRDPTFLLQTGIAQVHDVFTLLKQRLSAGV